MQQLISLLSTALSGTQTRNCLKDSSGNSLNGRMGLGRESNALCKN